MIRLKDLLEEAVYKGDPGSSSKTSRPFKNAAESVKNLYNIIGNDAKSNPNYKIIDYGAGVTGRNAKFFRDLGIKTYAYDYTHIVPPDGWTGVSNQLPDGHFNFGFSCYVLNVVTEEVENNIISWLDAHCDVVYHITRNKDIKDLIINSLSKPNLNNIISKFFVEEFRPAVKVEGGGKNYKTPIGNVIIDGIQLTQEEVDEFCIFGTKTTDGFQRIPMLENKGFTLVKQSFGSKVYKR
jgi:hypothetical protein